MANKEFVQIKDGGLLIKLKELTPKIEKTLLDETQVQADKLTNWIVKNHLSGPHGADKLAVKSGNFRRLTLPIKPKIYSNRMRAGTQFSGAGARVHIGPRGQVTTIKPLTSKYLAIPIGEGLTAGGVARYSGPRAVPGLDLITSLRGNLLLVRQVGDMIEPFFLLLKQVEIPARVHPEDIMKKNIQKIARDYRNALKITLEKG